MQRYVDAFRTKANALVWVYLLTWLSFQLSSLVIYLIVLCCGDRSPGTDVQLTKDLVPVLFHDYSLSESGTDIPIHDVTLEQVGLYHFSL